MALTLTPVRAGKVSNMRLNVYKVAFDNSYPTNGEPLSAKQLGLETVLALIPLPSAGYEFEYDYTNAKLKAYYGTNAQAAHTHAVALDGGASAAGSAHTHTFTGTAPKPLLVVEEAVTVASDVGTLAHVPLYIVAVEVTAGTTTGAFNVIPVGETPLTKQVAVDFTTGGLTFLTGDAVTAVRVTYLPKRASGSLSTVTVDEQVTAAAAGVNLAARAGLVQYVWNDTNGVLCGLEPRGEQPSATNKAVVDINNSGDTTIDTHAADDGDTLKVTYVPFSAIPAACFIDDTNITLNSQVWDFDANGGYDAVIIPGLGTQLVGEDGTSGNQQATWVGPSGTAADGVAKWEPLLNKITTAQTTAMATTAISWLALDPLQLTLETPAGTNANESAHTHGPGTLADAASGTGGAISAAAASEVANATNLSSVTCYVLAFGL